MRAACGMLQVKLDWMLLSDNLAVVDGRVGHRPDELCSGPCRGLRFEWCC